MTNSKCPHLGLVPQADNAGRQTETLFDHLVGERKQGFLLHVGWNK